MNLTRFVTRLTTLLTGRARVRRLGHVQLQRFTTYGREPAGQDMPAGTSYTDTVTATVNF